MLTYFNEKIPLFSKRIRVSHGTVFNDHKSFMFGLTEDNWILIPASAFNLSQYAGLLGAHAQWKTQSHTDT